MVDANFAVEMIIESAFLMEEIGTRLVPNSYAKHYTIIFRFLSGVMSPEQHDAFLSIHGMSAQLSSLMIDTLTSSRGLL